MRGSPTATVRIARSPHGLGLFAAEDIPEGATILFFTGEPITLEEVLASGIDESYPLQIGPQLYLDLDSRSRVINHSCTPNAGLRSDRILVALRGISRGEEIYYDYSTTISERRWEMRCGCKERACRQTVGDFGDLPVALQRAYLRIGIVQSFIVLEYWDTLTGRTDPKLDAPPTGL